MRKFVTALITGLLVLAGLAVPASSAAATPQPKVVIIVGPVASMTSSYKADAEAAYVEARRYTTNVIRLYSPTATWAVVKPALQGASVVIYLGHGNGFPSPYRTSPWPYSQNGLGLNPKAGTDNSTTQYWGEYYIGREVKLAPNAVVLLNHLCYASGNSEPGKPAPTLAVARQRADNMTAGWLKAGARAVVAEAHFGPAWYVRQLFTTHKTIDQIFHDSPTFNDRAFTFASSRTAGATVEMDPNGTPGGYWRAVTGWLDTTTDQMTGAAYADTGVDPADFVVPGNASVAVDTAGVYAGPALTPESGTGKPEATLPRDTRVHLLARAAAPTPDGHPIFQVASFDGTTTGWMSGADLVPRDSASPVIWSADDGDGAFSPNADGHGDLYRLSARISESADWTVAFETAGGTVLATTSGSGATIDTSWSGIVGGSPVADGTYRYVITATDGWGNAPGTRSGTYLVDTVQPAFVASAALAAATGSPPPTFSPNGDRSGDSIALPFSMDEPGYVDATVTNGSGATVRTFSVRTATGSGSAVWDGLGDGGTVVPDGAYTVSLAPRDYAANVGGSEPRTVAVYGAVGWAASSKTVFYPQDLDRYAKTTRFSFVLASDATVTWTVRNAAGAVVYTRYAGAALPKGTYTFDWNGRRTDRTMAPGGVYTSWVEATNGTVSGSARASVTANGFRATFSDTTPGRGQSITISIISPEPLKRSPRVGVYESRLAGWSVALTKTGTYTYRVTLRLKTGGAAGSVRFAFSGVDAAGGMNRASMTLPLH